MFIQFVVWVNVLIFVSVQNDLCSETCLCSELSLLFLGLDPAWPPSGLVWCGCSVKLFMVKQESAEDSLIVPGRPLMSGAAFLFLSRLSV